MMHTKATGVNSIEMLYASRQGFSSATIMCLSCVVTP
jgi:hypothetical protein